MIFRAISAEGNVAATNDNTPPGGFRHMTEYRSWWRQAKKRLEWRPIDTFHRPQGPAGLADPMILRSPDLWALGTWYYGQWVKVVDGGYIPLDGFVPTQWAEPTLADHIHLAGDHG